MNHNTKISEFTTNAHGEIYIKLVSEVSCTNEELAGFTYRLKRLGESELATEIENVANNIFSSKAYKSDIAERDISNE